MDAAEIRSLYVETLAEVLFLAWTGWRGIEGYVWADCEQGTREDFLDHAATYVGRFAERSLLPVGADYRWAYEPDGTPLGYREVSLYTAWREVAAPCRGCGVSERECSGLGGVKNCCAECRHPLREVPMPGLP